MISSATEESEDDEGCDAISIHESVDESAQVHRSRDGLNARHPTANRRPPLLGRLRRTVEERMIGRLTIGSRSVGI